MALPRYKWVPLGFQVAALWLLLVLVYGGPLLARCDYVPFLLPSLGVLMGFPLGFGVGSEELSFLCPFAGLGGGWLSCLHYYDVW